MRKLSPHLRWCAFKVPHFSGVYAYAYIIHTHKGVRPCRSHMLGRLPPSCLHMKGGSLTVHGGVWQVVLDWPLRALDGHFGERPISAVSYIERQASSHKKRSEPLPSHPVGLMYMHGSLPKAAQGSPYLSVKDPVKSGRGTLNRGAASTPTFNLSSGDDFVLAACPAQLIFGDIFGYRGISLGTPEPPANLHGALPKPQRGVSPGCV